MVSKLKYGNTNTFFIQGTNGGLLIDTDYAGTLSSFYKWMRRYIKKGKLSLARTLAQKHYYGMIRPILEKYLKLECII